MKQLMARGHSVTIAARDKDVTVDLLRRGGFTFSTPSRASASKAGMLFELLRRDLGILKLMLRHRVRIAVGTSASISHLSLLTRSRAIVVEADDVDCIPEFAALAYPMAHAILTPEGVRVGRWAHKQVTHPSYHELAYLHPDLFSPDEEVYRALRLNPNDPFCVVRLSAMKAHHDAGEKGLSPIQLKRLMEIASRSCPAFIVSESELPSAFKQHALPLPSDRIHDVLAFATCLVSDSQTMTREAAVLGTPALRCNSFVGRLSVLNELERKYQLCLGYRPEAFEEMLKATSEILSAVASTRELWARRREKMLAEKVNLTDWLVSYLEAQIDPPRH